MLHRTPSPVRALNTLALILFSAYVFQSISAHATTPTCERTRGVIDIGSGTTKLKVARVDICTGNLLQTLAPSAGTSIRQVSYKAALANSPTHEFTPTVMEAGIQAVLELKAEAVRLGATEFTAIATAAFREAINAPAFAQVIRERTGIQTQIISQRQEGLLGFEGAVGALSASTPLDQVLVWDIGGASMQMTTLGNDAQWSMYEGLMAAESFRQALISQVQGKDLARVSSPNPVSREDVANSTQVLRPLFSDIPALIRSRLADSRTQVIGIGGVHNICVGSQIARAGGTRGTLTLEGLDRAIQMNLGLTDAEIPNSQFAANEVSNLLLVHGFMEGLHIRSVTLSTASIAEGALVHPAFWAPQTGPHAWTQ